MTDLIKFAHATGRNTKAYTIILGHYPGAQLRLGISYNTIVAVDYWTSGEQSFRISKRLDYISRTTNRHLSEMGVKRYPVVSEEELNQTIRQALMEIGLGLVGPQWVEAAKLAA